MCCVVRSRNSAVWQTSNKVLDTDGFCVCDDAQSFLQRAVKGNAGAVQHIEQEKYPDVIQTTPFIRTPSSGRFSFLKQHTCQPKEHTTFHSGNLVFARSPIPASTIHLLPNASKVRLDESLCDVFEVTAPLRCALCDDSSCTLKTLFCSFFRNFDTALSQIRIVANRLVCRRPSQQQLPRRESSISMWVIVSSSAFIKDFLNCATVKSSSSHTVLLTV